MNGNDGECTTALYMTGIIIISLKRIKELPRERAT